VRKLNLHERFTGPRESMERTARASKLTLSHFIIIAFVFCVAIEISAQIIWQFYTTERLESQLHGYDRIDYWKGILVPIPGSIYTADGMMRTLEEEGKLLGVANLEEDSRELHYDEEDVIFRINSLGFKGPEIAEVKSPDTLRILTLGGSETFGSYVESLCYPRLLESSLKERDELPFSTIEVVNGAMMGYNIRSVASRIEEQLGIDPDVVTIMLGWNKSISRVDPARSDTLYRISATYRMGYHILRTLLPYPTKAYYDPNQPILGDLRNHDFRWALVDLGRLLDQIHELSPDARIVLLTLPGLFVEGIVPSADALEKGYSTGVTANVEAWGILAGRWNEELRQIAGEDHIDVIDLAQMVP
jgi:GDSL-like Lipase/Acylhydrolase family